MYTNINLAAPIGALALFGTGGLLFIYTTDVAFNLPAQRKPVALLLNEGAWETRLLIGHENSLLHGKTKFQIRTHTAAGQHSRWLWQTTLPITCFDWKIQHINSSHVSRNPIPNQPPCSSGENIHD